MKREVIFLKEMLLVLILGVSVTFRLVTSTYVNGEQEDWNTRVLGSAQPYYQQQPQQQQQQQQNFGSCPFNSQCVPLESCPLYANLLNNACVNTNRIASLGCGYIGSGLICCPINHGAGGGQARSIGSGFPRYPNGEAAGVGGRTLDEQRCGRPMVQGDNNYLGLGSHPWVVRIGFRNTLTGEIRYPCAGSIISKRIILTAAHCALAKADNYKLFSVRVGEWRTDSTLDCSDEFCAVPVQDIALSHVIVHPSFDKQTFKDDIALMVLRADINYTATAQPICVIDSYSQPSNQAFLIGWGRTAGQQIPTPFQQAVELPVINLQQCINVYSRTIPITDDHLCAGGQFGRDACEGFGGGPLIVKHSEVYYQIGILSFGSNQCGAAGTPSVYSSIKKYAQWIKDNTPVVYS